MASMLMDVSDDNKGPTIAQHLHNDRSGAMICYNPVEFKAILQKFRYFPMEKLEKESLLTDGFLIFNPLWYHKQYVYCNLCSSGPTSIGGSLSTSTSTTSVSLSSLSAPPYAFILYKIKLNKTELIFIELFDWTIRK